MDAQKMSVDCFTRTKDNAWVLHSDSIPNQHITLDALNIKIQLTELYAEVGFKFASGKNHHPK